MSKNEFCVILTNGFDCLGIIQFNSVAIETNFCISKFPRQVQGISIRRNGDFYEIIIFPIFKGVLYCTATIRAGKEEAQAKC
ncbi:hypothetical protein [Bacteroides rodentium]